jgi:uncharacterized Zn ribbon protein
MNFTYKDKTYLVKDYKINKDTVTVRFGNYVKKIPLTEWVKING